MEPQQATPLDLAVPSAWGPGDLGDQLPTLVLCSLCWIQLVSSLGQDGCGRITKTVGILQLVGCRPEAELSFSAIPATASPAPGSVLGHSSSSDLIWSCTSLGPNLIFILPPTSSVTLTVHLTSLSLCFLVCQISALSFPGYVPCTQEVYVLFNFCFSPVMMSFSTGEASAKNLEGQME